MLNTRSFSQILEEFSDAGVTSSAPFEYESHCEPAGLAELTVLVNLRATRAAHPSVYGKRKAQPSAVRPAHRFEAPEQEAFELLQHYARLACGAGAEPLLNSNFNGAELKRAYRQAVKQAHPDRGGSSESFLRVRRSYQILLALLTKVS